MKNVYLSPGHGRSKKECEVFLGKTISFAVWDEHVKGAFLLCSLEQWKFCLYLKRTEKDWFNSPLGSDYTEVFFDEEVLL